MTNGAKKTPTKKICQRSKSQFMDIRQRELIKEIKQNKKSYYENNCD